ncbi:hypothetical protein [Flaviaesturariibacter terrae]
MNGIAAVLTADIVNSTALGQAASTELRADLETGMKAELFEFFRGDSFQALLRDPEEGLKAALAGRCAARSLGTEYDVRCSIGIGRVDGAITQLATASGEAFLLSGRAFDSLGSDQRLSIVSGNAACNAAFRILAAYCDHLFQGLTAKQASVVLALLSGKTQTEAATQLQVTQATISNHAHSAGWSKIEWLLAEYAALCRTLTQNDRS